MKERRFLIELNQTVELTDSGETGTVIGRAEFAHSEDSYLVRYKTADGRLTEQWWGESAIAIVRSGE